MAGIGKGIRKIMILCVGSKIKPEKTNAETAPEAPTAL